MSVKSMSAHDLPTRLNQWLAPLGATVPELFVVGGALRDHMAGRLPRDVDIICDEAPNVARCIAKARLSGAVVVKLEKKPHPPCFRVVDKNNPAEYIDVVPLRSGGIRADLLARDFTVNAMAGALLPGGRIGEIIDPLGGMADMQKGLLRACSETAFAADPVRILRAARFAATLDFTIFPETLDQMAAAVGLLTRSAFERITAELFELLACPDALPHIQMLDDIGALEVLFPEIAAMKGCAQNGFHHLDVWGHTLETLEHCERLLRRPDVLFTKNAAAFCRSMAGKNRLPVIKLATLLHDAGKPGCKIFDETKHRQVFYGHGREGETIAGNIAHRMKLSNSDTAFLQLLVRCHMRPMALSRPGVKPATITRWFETVADNGLALLLLAAADTCAKSGSWTDPMEKERFCQWADQTAADYCLRIRPVLGQTDLLSGADLQDMGMAPGPDMGRVLKTVRQHQNDGRVTDKAAALALARQLAGL